MKTNQPTKKIIKRCETLTRALSSEKRKELAIKVNKKGSSPATGVASVESINDDLPKAIRAVFRTVNEYGIEQGKLVVETQDRDGRVHCYSLDLTQLAQNRNDELASLVVRLGLTQYLSTKGLRTLSAIFIDSAKDLVYATNRDGFHQITSGGETYKFFVHRNQIHPLGQELPIRICVLNNQNALPPAFGTLNDWHLSIGRHLKRNPKLLVPILAALACSLVRAFGLYRLILALIGPSSTGKSTGQQAAQSVRESGSAVEDFAGTTKGLRTLLEQYNDSPACLQDLHLAEDMAGIVELVFLIANGATRKTSTADQKVSATNPMSCGLILSSERTLIEILAKLKLTPTDGVSARYFECAIDAPNGIFSHVPNGMTAKQFAEQINLASSTHYGSVWDAWIPAISKHAAKIEAWLPKNLPLIEAELCAGLEITDRVTLRMVKGLASWVCAGILAINLKILMLHRDDVIDATRLVLREHLARQKHKSTPTGEKVIQAVCDLIDRNTGRFPSLTQFGRSEQNGIFGYSKGSGEKMLYLFLPSVFEEHVGDQFGMSFVLHTLKEKGLLETDVEGSQRQFRIPTEHGVSERKRFYAIKAAIRYEAKH
jgi:hypothetical protein